MLMQRSVGEDGLHRSAVFPGLWLDPHALLRGDRQRLRSLIDLGCATVEHAEFVAPGQGPKPTLTATEKPPKLRSAAVHTSVLVTRAGVTPFA